MRAHNDLIKFADLCNLPWDCPYYLGTQTQINVVAIRRTGLRRSYRKGISWVKLMKLFPDDANAETWFAKQRWGNEPVCPHCQSTNVQTGAKHHMPYRCRSCRKRFSVRVGTVMQDSKLSYQVWAMAIYIVDTGIKGVSSMKLHHGLDITRTTAWHLAHRIRKSWDMEIEEFTDPVEVDETYFGGKEKNKLDRKKLKADRVTPDRTASVGATDHETKQVQAKVVIGTITETLTQRFGARSENT